MTVDQKDVMITLVGAAAAAAGFGLALDGVVVALIETQNVSETFKDRLERMAIVSLIAFVCAALAAFLAFAWLLVGSVWRGWDGILPELFYSSLVLFLISVGLFTVILGVFTRSLKRSVFVITGVFSGLARLAVGKKGPIEDHDDLNNGQAQAQP